MDSTIAWGVMTAIIAVVFGWILTTSMRRRSAERFTLIWTAAGEAEAQLFAQRLKSVGVRVLMKNVGDSPQFTSPNAYEIWVPPRDVSRARQILGLE